MYGKQRKIIFISIKNLQLFYMPHFSCISQSVYKHVENVVEEIIILYISYM